MRFERFWSNLADDYLTLPVALLDTCQGCGGTPDICWLYPEEAPPDVLCRSCTDPRELADLNTIQREIWPPLPESRGMTDDDIPF